MITFKQFLTEARMAPLYHGTYSDAIENILIDERGILPKTLHLQYKIGIKSNYNNGQDEFVQGVSFTRNIHFANNWGSGWILEMDQRLLSQNYKIVPYQFFRDNFLGARSMGVIGSKTGRYDESEEYVVTTKPIPTKYIKALWVDKHTLGPKGFEPKLITKIRQKYGSSFIKIYG